MLGLLLCDHVPENLQHLGGDYPDMFRKLFPETSMRVYPVCEGVFPKSVDECDAYLVTGSRRSVYEEEDWILQLKKFVRQIHEANKYYIGICFGHQMLAEALGGKVQKSEKGWCVGVHEFEIVEKTDWMQAPKKQLNLLMMCQDQVQVLPEGSILLAKTPQCPVGMFVVGNKMLGIQAHPEFSKAYDKILMEQRVARIGEEKVKDGLASLALETDELVFASWVRGLCGI